MKMCDHDVDVYLDYRWLPETTSAFARDMVETYADASRKLEAAAERLAAGVPSDAPERLLHITRIEVKRARFEAAELRVMHYQQDAVIHFAEYLNTGNREKADKGCELLNTALEIFKDAKSKAQDFGLTEKSWYLTNINKWLTGEFERKIKNYKG
jgi:predicted outer membrane protein